MGLDAVRLNQGQGGDLVGVDSINGVDYQVVKLAHGAEGTVALADATHGIPVVDAAAEASLASIATNEATVAAATVASATALAGTLTTKVAGAASATLTTVAASATSVQLLAANSAARQRIIINDSTAPLYLKYGSAASSLSYTYVLPPKQDTTMSSLTLAGNELYTGLIHGIWSSATGSATITEVA